MAPSLGITEINLFLIFVYMNAVAVEESGVQVERRWTRAENEAYRNSEEDRVFETNIMPI
jgi:hypothetical protein